MKQENNRNLMYRVYLHEFCKVVTSVGCTAGNGSEVYLHEFCKVVTSAQLSWTTEEEVYLHEFCKECNRKKKTK